MTDEKRQLRLQINAEAIERWQRKLFRAATELKKLTDERKRLLRPRGPPSQGAEKRSDAANKAWETRRARAKVAPKTKPRYLDL